MTIWLLFILACAGIIITPRPTDELTPRIWMRALIASALWIVIIVWGLVELNALAQMIKGR